MMDVQRTIEANSEMAALNEADRVAVQMWLRLLDGFEAAEDKGAALASILAEHRGDLRLSRGTFYRHLAAYREGGARALMPLRERRRLDEATHLPMGFMAFWQQHCYSNQRRIAPAYRSLFFDWLMAGKVIPGYDTNWEGIWRAAHPGWDVPAACPYRPGVSVPAGWTERNLRRYAPGQYQLVVARQGRAAGRELLPKIPTTRVGLPFGRVFVMDDVEHDALIMFAGNREPRGVVELGAMELLTGHYCSWGAKPVRERADGTREKLKEAYVRYLLADIACRIGFSRQGCLIAGEHGTARVTDSILGVLNKWSGGLFEFQAGGLLKHPIAKGLWLGLRRGNFRFKAALESHHSLKKNELAQLPGQKGADPEHAPEDLESKSQRFRALIKACAAVAERDPGIYERIRTEFPPWYDYIQAVHVLYGRIAARSQHAIEGYQECGFVTQMWRMNGGDVWKPYTEVDRMAEDEQEMVRALIRRNPRERHMVRLMSPQEAFTHAAASADLVRLPDAAVPDILGRDLGVVLAVEDDATLYVRDEYLPNKRYPVVARVTQPDGRRTTLERGTSWLVHLSPFDSRKAYVSTTDGAFVGVAPVMVAGTKTDTEELRRNLGIVASVEAAELRKLAPLGEKRLREKAEMHEHNVRELAGLDPLADAAAAKAQAKRLRGFEGADLLDDGDCGPEAGFVDDGAEVAAGAPVCVRTRTGRRFDAAGLL